MTKCGMVRRIDDLGRVVIPKEMRKTLMIEKGDTVEIYVENSELKIKKYSPISNLKSFANLTAEIIAKNTKKSCIITDTDLIISACKNYKNFIGEQISKQLVELLRKGKPLNTRKGQTPPVSILKENVIELYNQIVVPIIKQGDVFGAVILFDNDENVVFTECDLRLVDFGASFLSEQFEV